MRHSSDALNRRKLIVEGRIGRPVFFRYISNKPEILQYGAKENLWVKTVEKITKRFSLKISFR